MQRSISITVELKPNQHMKHYLNQMCDYRRYCWNKGLATWQMMYYATKIDSSNNHKPNERRVRNEMVHDKTDWQCQYSARILQLAIKDLTHAFKAFFDKKRPDFGFPHFKSKKLPRQGFKSDRAKLVRGKLRLDRARGYSKKDFYDIRINGLRKVPGELKQVAITRKSNRYTANLSFITDEEFITTYTGKVNAVDVNVGHFNDINGLTYTYGKKLKCMYEQNRHYQRSLARKRKNNPEDFRNKNNYQEVKAKLQHNYVRITNIQNDILHKYTTSLVRNYDQIIIEDLDVNHMKMSHIASKGLQRSMFGRFRQLLTYKCLWYGKRLILADRFYPSTQRCSYCGYIKRKNEKITLQGNLKHHTNHYQFICYHCGFYADRDTNAVNNLLALAN